MTHSAGRRVTAILAILLLLLPGVGEAMGRACEHHDGAMPRAAYDAPGSAAHGHAEHHGAAHTGHPAADEQHSGEEHSHDRCTCPGTCAMGSGAAAPAAHATSLRLGFTRAAAASVPTAQSHSPRFLPFVLPYAQAPPAGC